MWSGENYASDFSISSFGLAVPQLVEGSHPQEQQQQQLEPPGSNHDVNCGMLGVYPSFLQGYRTHRCYLICLCVLGMTQGFVVNGLVSVVTPTIEKRFQLLGIEVGIIQSMFNVASCIMTTPVSYHGGVGHKPVILGIGALFVATGSMVFASPHFLAPPYMPLGSGSADSCPQRGLPEKCAVLARSGAASANSFKYFFMVGHALHGVGSSPFYTLGVAYLDQNTPSASASVYMGIFYATSVLGPALGFLLGGYFLSKYTDITADPSKLGMDPSSANWVGAWWLGFSCACIVTFLTAFPMASFPRALPTAVQRAKDLSRLQKAKAMKSQKQTQSETDVQAAPEVKAIPDVQATSQASGAPLATRGSVTTVVSPASPAIQTTYNARATLANQATTLGSLPTAGSQGSVGAQETADHDAQRDMQMATETTVGKAHTRSLVNHIKRLTCNSTFICLTLAACAESIVSVPSACGGTLLGGYAITKLNFKSSTIVRYCVVLSFVPWFTLFVFMHSCPSNHSALVNITTWDERRDAVRSRTLTFGDLSHSCNAHCNCSGVGYDPVCGSDNFTYYSPCVAGCGNVRNFRKTKLYSQCTCVHGPTLFMASEGESNETGFHYMARRDPCTADCGLIVVYAAAVFVALFFTFLLIVPALTALLRALDEDIKSTGIGVNYVAIRLLGTIPGPILFGYLIDRSCILWESTCSGGSGACAIYENSAMGMNLFRTM
nr:solute carrier organic anion transporter family member 4A1-like [Rhipicephalus microplus]